MTTHELTTTATAAGIREHLDALEREQATAGLTGLAANATYMGHLRDELQATRAAWVGAAVTEIASLRAALDGALHG